MHTEPVSELSWTKSSVLTSIHMVSRQTQLVLTQFGSTQLNFSFTLQAMQVGIVGKLIKD